MKRALPSVMVEWESANRRSHPVSQEHTGRLVCPCGCNRAAAWPFLVTMTVRRAHDYLLRFKARSLMASRLD